MDIETTRLLKRALPLFTGLAAVLLVLALGAILNLGRDIFVPVALAVVLSFVLAPAVRGLQRLGLPQGAAVMIVVLLAVGAFAGLALVVGGQLAALGADLPRYQGTIRDKLLALGSAGSDGTFSRALKSLEEIGADLARVSGAGGEGKATPVVVQESTGFIGTLGVVVSPLLHPLATAFLVVVFVVFVLAAREDLRNRLVRLVGADDMQHTTAVIDDAARRLSRLFLMQLAVNAAFGVVIGLGLWVIGVPSPVLWGALAGVLRFVPYVGAVIGAVPPLALAFAVDPGWSMLAWTALLFVLVEPLLGHVLEPLLFGHSTGLSPVAVVLAAAVWTFLWGPIGLVLATPLTVCLVVLGRHVAGLSFLDVMLGDRPALSPPQIFYQRMLAGDPAEAILQAREFLRERALSTYYDEVALEALRLAHEDVARARLAPGRQETLRASTGALVARLDEAVRDPRPKGGQVGAEAAAAVQAAGPDRGAATQVLAPDDLDPAWRGPAPVVCFARADTVDAIIAEMLAQVLTKHGIPARVLTENTDPENLPDGVRMVCLSYVEPLSTLHLRHAVRVARRRFPGARVLLGVWRDRDPGMVRTLGRAARADIVTPTIGAALSDIVAAAQGGVARGTRAVSQSADRRVPAARALARAG
jgi:predicted PurR-regulated permease PerM